MRYLLPIIGLSVVIVGCQSPTTPPTAQSGCGVVSTSMLPPQTQDLFPVAIEAINDKPVLRKTIHTLVPGQYTIKLYEQIVDPRFSGKLADRRAKFLQLTVARDTRYHLAAHFDPDKRYSRDQYWSPEIWKVTEQACHPE